MHAALTLLRDHRCASIAALCRSSFSHLSLSAVCSSATAAPIRQIRVLAREFNEAQRAGTTTAGCVPLLITLSQPDAFPPDVEQERCVAMMVIIDSHGHYRDDDIMPKRQLCYGRGAMFSLADATAFSQQEHQVDVGFAHCRAARVNRTVRGPRSGRRRPGVERPRFLQGWCSGQAGRSCHSSETHLS